MQNVSLSHSSVHNRKRYTTTSILIFQLDFDDVIAEPSAAQGFEWVWKLAFVVFSQTKTWLYKIFSAILAVPAALLWALVFALLTVVYIWILSPALKLFDLTLAVVKRVSLLILA